MVSSEQDDNVDRLAQAVIDKIEQRDETAYLVNQVALRVMEMQKRDADLKAKAAEAADASGPAGNSPVNENTTEED